MTVALLSHPLGERDADWGMKRGDNLANAMDWFRFLKDTLGWAICYPAMAYLAAVDDVFHRPSMITDIIEIMGKCDVLVVCGGRASPHMRIELDHARRRSPPLPILDLVDLGYRTRPEQGEVMAIEIRRRAGELGLWP